MEQGAYRPNMTGAFIRRKADARGAPTTREAGTGAMHVQAQGWGFTTGRQQPAAPDEESSPGDTGGSTALSAPSFRTLAPELRQNKLLLFEATQGPGLCDSGPWILTRCSASSYRLFIPRCQAPGGDKCCHVLC